MSDVGVPLETHLGASENGGKRSWEDRDALNDELWTWEHSVNVHFHFPVIGGMDFVKPLTSLIPRAPIDVRLARCSFDLSRSITIVEEREERWSHLLPVREKSGVVNINERERRTRQRSVAAGGPLLLWCTLMTIPRI